MQTRKSFPPPRVTPKKYMRNFPNKKLCGSFNLLHQQNCVFMKLRPKITAAGLSSVVA